jgi:protoporphyrinogen oxidase
MILILGAGLTGLATAYYLKNRDCLVVEKGDRPGGLCGTTEQKGFHFDYTGHFLHVRDDSVKALIFDLLPDGWIRGERASFIHYKDTYTPFPFQAHTHGLPAEVIRDCLVGYIRAYGARGRDAGKDQSFRAWVESRFGEGFAKHFFIPYNTKIWRTPLEDITTEWVSWAVPMPEPEEVVDGALGTGEARLGYNVSFYYPARGGIGTFTDALARRVEGIAMGREAVAVEHADRVVHFKDGSSQRYDRLVSTLPLKKLLEITTGIPAALKEAGENLRYVSVFNLNLGIDRKDETGRHWIYFPEDRFPFYRTGMPSNVSEGTGPPGTTSYYVEVSYLPEEKPAEEALRASCIEKMKALDLIGPSDRILAEEIKQIEYAYVIYDAHRRAHLEGILGGLAALGIHSVGRYGAWEYSFMESAILAGKNLAESFKK